MKKLSSENLQRIIKEKGYTRSEISDKSGISPMSIYRLISGDVTNPRIDTLLSICNILEISIIELLEEDK